MGKLDLLNTDGAVPGRCWEEKEKSALVLVRQVGAIMVMEVTTVTVMICKRKALTGFPSMHIHQDKGN